jgi:hypothetical protein
LYPAAVVVDLIDIPVVVELVVLNFTQHCHYQQMKMSELAAVELAEVAVELILVQLGQVLIWEVTQVVVEVTAALLVVQVVTAVRAVVDIHLALEFLVKATAVVLA